MHLANYNEKDSSIFDLTVRLLNHHQGYIVIQISASEARGLMCKDPRSASPFPHILLHNSIILPFLDQQLLEMGQN
jgi:hypothetical protein